LIRRYSFIIDDNDQFQKYTKTGQLSLISDYYDKVERETDALMKSIKPEQRSKAPRIDSI